MDIITELADQSEVVRTNCAEMRMLRNKILYVRITPGHEQSLDDAFENLAAARRFCHTVKIPVIMDIRGVPRPSNGVLQTYGRPDLADFPLCMAFIADMNYLSQSLINLYFKLSGPIYPMKMCFTTDEAIHWLDVQRKISPFADHEVRRKHSLNGLS